MSGRKNGGKVTKAVKMSRPRVQDLAAQLAVVNEVAADRWAKLQDQAKLLESQQRIIDANKVAMSVQQQMIIRYEKAIGRIALECQGTRNDIDMLGAEVFKLKDQADREKRRSDVIVWNHILQLVRDADGRVPSPYGILNKVMNGDAAEQGKVCGDQCPPAQKAAETEPSADGAKTVAKNESSAMQY